MVEQKHNIERLTQLANALALALALAQTRHDFRLPYSGSEVLRGHRLHSHQV